ncbi:hypothetical protein NKI56_10355 [Mesorhizobium sp. M0622]|uniref:hypothetical protein n=1 Tax=unclassified Mesorhizobium TaxID=325217 RepID=UPI0033380A48
MLLAMTIWVVVFRHLPNLHFSDPPYVFHERIGAILASVITGFLLPYGAAWLSGRLMQRSRSGFLRVLWPLAIAIFLLNFGLLYECPTCY